jgi:hypothetical protein
LILGNFQEEVAVEKLEGFIQVGPVMVIPDHFLQEWVVLSHKGRVVLDPVWEFLVALVE